LFFVDGLKKGAFPFNDEKQHRWKTLCDAEICGIEKAKEKIALVKQIGVDIDKGK
jgi:hypothetical protein